MSIITHDCTTGEITERELTAEEETQRQQEATESAWSMLRAHRDGLLVTSDWTQVADAPVDATAWKRYRQALRDLPANTTDPTAPDWPTPPT